MLAISFAEILDPPHSVHMFYNTTISFIFSELHQWVRTEPQLRVANR